MALASPAAGSIKRVMFKRLAQSPAIPWIGGTLLWAYMALLVRTLGWRTEGLDGLRAAWEGRRPFVLAAWHSRILLMGYVPVVAGRNWSAPVHPLSIMVSNSRDGEFTQRTSRLFGLNVIRGSAANVRKKKDKRGVPAAREALRIMDQGGGVMVTIDGPKGPPEVVGIGAIKLAQQMNADVFVYGLSASGRRLGTWDRLLLPPPFGRGALVIGAPIRATKSVDSENLRLQVEQALKDATARADVLAGREAEALPASRPASPPHGPDSSDPVARRSAP